MAGSRGGGGVVTLPFQVVANHGGIRDTYRVRNVSSLWRFTFGLPDNFGTLISCKLRGIVDQNGNNNGTFTLETNYGGNGDSDSLFNETETTAEIDFSARGGQHLDVDLLPVLSSLGAGHGVGLLVTQTGLGSNMNWLYVHGLYLPGG